jgi:CO/xanthine dehydrogenase Mo-binding subunit
MAILTTREVKGVGFAIPRPDGPEKVTGRTQYVADIRRRGMLEAKLLRSPHAHARIVRIDTSKAKALPGVRAVLTAADIPELHPNAPTRGHAIMAIDRAVFAGQPVAAVAADELAIAEEALDLIEVEYEVLPVAVDPLKSMQPDAPRVADEGTEADTSEAMAHSGVAAQESEEEITAPNVTQQSKLSRGDLAKGFAEADVIVEKIYQIPMVHQGYIEAHAALAEWDASGNLTIWASTQGSFNTRTEVADIFGMPQSRINVIPMECGGGFGAKIRALVEPITALLARATGRPVRYVMTRREELEAGMPAPQVRMRLKAGVKKDGTLTAMEAETILDVGAYAGAMLTLNGIFLASLYKFPNFEVRGFEVLTHKPSIAAYRAPTAPHTVFAIDSHMDLIARTLGMEPAEFRLRHIMVEGDAMATGAAWASNGAKACLERIVEHPLWQNRAEWAASGGKDGHGLRGTGLALGGWIPGIQPCSATIKLNPDGTLSITTGQVDIAGTNVGLQQIAATAFGIDYDQVQIVTGDTNTAPLAGVSAGSKVTYTMGPAVIAAAEDARRQTFKIAADELEASVDDLAIEDGHVVVQGVPDRSISLADIGKKTNTFGSKVAPVLGVGSLSFTQQAPAFAAQLARIEVDPETGDLTIHDFVAVQDVGFAINPLGIEGQIQGGAVQSLGIALTEGLLFDEDGRLTNPSLLDYRKLTAADVPNIETILVEVPAPAGPYGARGVGEPPITPAPAAIANAIHDATGVRITELPITPERIALALLEEGSAKG